MQHDPTIGFPVISGLHLGLLIIWGYHFGRQSWHISCYCGFQSFFFPDGSKATKHFTFDGEVAMIIWSYCSFEENDSPLIKHGNGTFPIDDFPSELNLHLV